MADIIGYRGAISATGTPIPELYVDQGDGTFARRVTTTDGDGLVGYIGAIGPSNGPIAVRFIDQGDGTYAELVSAVS